MISVIGIDPGLTGAIAWYDAEEDKVIRVWDMPTQTRVYGKGDEIDFKALYTVFMEIDRTFAMDENTGIVAYLENVGVMPKQGIVSAFAFGQVVGGIRAALTFLDVPYYMIHPATWKRKFGLVGSDKDQTRVQILAAYPETKNMLSLKKHHNRADAIAIAIAGSKQ